MGKQGKKRRISMPLCYKKIAMLDDQSPIDKELKYAILTFEKMTEEQKNAVIEKMGDGYKNWQNELERIGTIGIFEKNTS